MRKKGEDKKLYCKIDLCSLPPNRGIANSQIIVGHCIPDPIVLCPVLRLKARALSDLMNEGIMRAF